MHEGDTVVFRITSSGTPANRPDCFVIPWLGLTRWEWTTDLDVGAAPGPGYELANKPKRAANGTCTVTLITAYEPGQFTLRVQENVYSNPPTTLVDIEATIDVVK